MPPSFIPKELPPFNANTSIGAFEIGTLLATTLFGATCIQVYIYFERYAKDHKLIKALVVFVWLLELGHTIAICHALYIMTVSWFTQPENLVILPVSVDASVLLSGLIGPLEQAWFIHRLYTFSKNKVLTGVCCILSFLRIFGSVALSGVSLQRLMLLEFDQKYWWLLMSIVIVGTLNDGLLAGSLAWYLNKSKNQTVARATNSVLNHLIMWVVETSAITSVATVSMMICFFTMPANLVYIGAYVCLAKLYANALLAS
ncbi:hypothetical protein BT96DRAFT_297907 [Gymnopus androsaceus JB14]|uniref:DUF6534 domain-containing protein n=1 Tax=Gymnopus androsaceus JB14 TaxID=1447944 RepID=A0A6A4H172_9AGAR|nr:hypothetical protein BT96DRAFT_297907 [Gymnopus androsaceus JB14]